MNPTDDLAPGEVYAFVLAEPGLTVVTPVAFAGTLVSTRFQDTVKTIDGARLLAERYLTFHHVSRRSNWPGIYGLWFRDRGYGWYDLKDIPGFRGSGGVCDLLPDPPEARREDGTYGIHKLVVPMADWGADPRLHVADWADPGASCAAAGDWVAEERRLKDKADAEMRRLLGFRPRSPSA